ncbi:branched-chain amino acid transaminase [Candidatus Woesearchaeota archaeon]|nr:branched-chain amino acid transaminase [Candidatus Woesearchaeota archaeon]
MVDKSEKIWMDGTFIDWDNAKVHVLTHALHYGSAIFEGIKCYETKNGPAIFRLKEHIDRLYGSAHIFGMKIPFSKQEFSEAVKNTVKVNKLKSCYIRPIVYLGYGPMGLNPVNSPVQCSIAAWSWGAYLGEEGIAKGIRLKTSSFVRNHVNAMMTKAKISGNYVNSILAKQEAVLEGFDESMMLDTEGYVSECSGENLFIVKNNVIKTPFTLAVLPGITRSTIIEIAKDLGYGIKEERFTRDEVYIADECFLTGTAAELTPVREVDNRQIGEGKPGKITKELQNLFLDIVHGKIKKYEHWLDYVK